MNNDKTISTRAVRPQRISPKKKMNKISMISLVSLTLNKSNKKRKAIHSKEKAKNGNNRIRCWPIYSWIYQKIRISVRKN